MAESCEICAAQRGRGPLVAPLVWQDELVFVCHAAASKGQVVLGHLIVETRRHVAYLHGLSDAEAQAVGRAMHRAAVGLRAELDVEFVHAAVVNQRMEHFHQHVFVRHRGTPAEFGWWPVDGWPDAPRSNASAVSALCARLRPISQPPRIQKTGNATIAVPFGELPVTGLASRAGLVTRNALPRGVEPLIAHRPVLKNDCRRDERQPEHEE